MSGNRIYLGPADRQPKTVNKPVAGAYLPGTFVIESESALTQATAFGAGLRLLSDREFFSTDWTSTTSPLLTAYASSDTGVAYKLEPGQDYLVAMAAGTYTFMDPLAVGANGRLAAAASGDVVVAFAKEAATYAAGDLAPVEITNFYTAS
jgi:hypothetical protein